MKLFLFKRIEQVSQSYHHEGGLVVVARDKDHVLELVVAESEKTSLGELHGALAEISLTDAEWGDVVEYELNGEVEPRVYIFPDAGCC